MTFVFGFALLIGATLLCVILLVYAYRNRFIARQLLAQAQQKIENAKKEVEAEKREAFIKLKDELYKKRIEFDAEIKKERAELERLQVKVNAKYENIEQKDLRLEDLRKELAQKERSISRTADILRANEQKLKSLYDELIAKLEVLSGMSREDARQSLFDTLDSEVRLSNQKWIAKVEEEARQVAKEKAINIVVNAMQRYTAEQVAPHSSGIVHLPNEEMKGRIIGKEGRNIKALEHATGMEFVIGEAPEIITISGFNPIRREVARRTLEKLILDGRINPTRIEETVQQCEREIDEMIQEYGRDVVLEFNLQGIHPEIITALGKLYFRTSYSQNV